MTRKKAKRVRSTTQPLQTLDGNGNAGTGSGTATLRPQEVTATGRFRKRTAGAKPLGDNSTAQEINAIPPDSHLESPISGAHVLKTIREEWEHAGSKLPPEGERTLMLEAFKRLRQATLDADAALKRARAEEAVHTLKLARAFGCQSLRLGDVIYDFASRGPAVFFRKRTLGVVDV